MGDLHYSFSASEWEQVQGQILELKTEVERRREELGSLLAVIHGDGGHHTDAVGEKQSVEDAHQIWVEQCAKVERLQGEYEEKCDAYHELAANYGPAIDEAKRLRSEAEKHEIAVNCLRGLGRAGNNMCDDLRREWKKSEDEIERLRAKTSGLETENQTLLVRLENRDAEIKRMQAIVGGLELQLLESTDARLQNQAIVDKLDKTADGVPVVPGMVVWDYNDNLGHAVSWDISIPANSFCGNINKCSSTREAAEAASKGGE